MTKRANPLPRPVEELEALAAYYDTHDTSSEMEDGDWVDPQPMKTTSLRLPADVVDALKAVAHARGMRYTAFIREIIEQVISGDHVAERQELVRINQRLAKIEEVVAGQPPMPGQPKSRRVVEAKVRQQNLTRRKVARAQGSMKVGVKSAKIGMKASVKSAKIRRS